MEGNLGNHVNGKQHQIFKIEYVLNILVRGRQPEEINKKLMQPKTMVVVPLRVT